MFYLLQDCEEQGHSGNMRKGVWMGSYEKQIEFAPDFVVKCSKSMLEHLSLLFLEHQVFVLFS